MHRASAGIPGLERAPSSPSKRGCLFHDEVFTGTTEHQNQLRMIISGRLGELRLYPGWIQVAASNPDSSDYSTVQEVDEALASRFVIICVDPTDDEKLIYWRTHYTLPDKLYSFLAMNRMHIQTLDSRAWANLGHSLRKWEAAGLDRGMIIRLFEANINKVVAAGFSTFLMKGDDPDEYPINVMDLILANAEQHMTHLKRVAKWVSKGNTATIGATLFDTRILLSGQSNIDQIKKLISVKQKACVNIVDMLTVLLGSHRALVADLIMHIKKGPIVSAMAEAISDNAVLEKAILDLDLTALEWMNKKANPKVA